MFRYNLCIAAVLLAMWLPSAAKSEETSISVGTLPAKLEIPEGFSLSGRTLTLPNGKTLEDCVGLQEFTNKQVLIVCRKAVFVYSRAQKRHVDMPLPQPIVNETEMRGNQQYSIMKPLILPSEGIELKLIPFDALVSNEPRAGKRMAFIAVQGAEKTRVGVYRYQVGQPALTYLPIFGTWYVPGRHLCWYTFMADAPKETVIRISLDCSGEPLSLQSHGYYCVERMSGKEWLRCVFPKRPGQAAAILAAQREKFTEKPAASKSPDE